MSMPGHHALLFEVAGGVVLVGIVLALTLTKSKKKTVEVLTEADMRRIDDRLISSDLARTESRFRRRYGVEPKSSDFTKKPPPEPTSEEPKP